MYNNSDRVFYKLALWCGYYKESIKIVALTLKRYILSLSQHSRDATSKEMKPAWERWSSESLKYQKTKQSYLSYEGLIYYISHKCFDRWLDFIFYYSICSIHSLRYSAGRLHSTISDSYFLRLFNMNAYDYFSDPQVIDRETCFWSLPFWYREEREIPDYIY